MGYIHIYSTINQVLRHYTTKSNSLIMKYLNVAEKNDAAKNIASILSKGSSTRREGLSQFNKIYEFTTTVLGQQCNMVMTSVSGHLLNYEFTSNFRNWRSCNPVTLFDAPVIKSCPNDYEKIKRTLEREIRSCHGLIIWTDCDREGENIGFEIIKVCTDIKPNLQIYRAKFSEITGPSIFRALNTLGQPNKNVSDAVDVRQELDLRTGAAFTRLQTLRLQQVFPDKLADKLISYGSCQFPTLGFVVERYQAIEDFIPEPFWKIKMNHTVKETTTDFQWKRDRLFDKNACEAILDICKENPNAKVESVESKTKNKWRPLPLDTVEMEKNISRKLKINSKEAMKIAEKLYSQGFISYPRTETNIFPKEINLNNLVELQRNDNSWGIFAQRILNEGGANPRQGKKSDKAHPPIHPIKYTNNLTGNEQRVYEYIVRHFLACVHKDAQGFETIVNVDIANEKFTAKGLIILEKNYLEVYIYEKWNCKEVYNYQEGDEFIPTVLDIVESSTTSPQLLTEADLIALMDKHGIGTDATHAEHIDTIQQRQYVGLYQDMYFVPGELGMGLVEGYNNIGLEVSLAKPILRSEFENDLKLICDGLKDSEIVRQEQIQKYRRVFEIVVEKMRLIDQSLGNRLNNQPQLIDNNEINNIINGIEEFKSILKCPKCGNDMSLRNKKDGGKFISCSGYPNCKNAIWLSTNITSIEVTDETCIECGPNVKKLKMKFIQNMFPGEPNPNTLCIGGCDRNVLDSLEIPYSSVIKSNNNTELANNSIINNSRLNESQINNNRLNNSNQNNGWINNNFPTSSTSSLSNNYLQTDTSRSNNNNNTSTRNEDIVCTCNREAILLTVRKDGPNKGRQFYKCQNSVCNFFLWATENAQNPTRPTTTITQNNVINCDCNLPAVQRTVSKAGPNVGRQFYCCSKPREEGCRFFKWADESNGGGGGGGGAGDDDDNDNGGGYRGQNDGNSNWLSKAKSKANKNSNKNQTRAKRKCGMCGEEGHTRTKCPNNN